MAVHTPTSWGRTRRPKHLHDDNPITDKQGASRVTVVTSDSLNDDLNDATAGENGYSTENQRFLHVFVKHSGSGSKTVTIWAYNYAFGEWAPLLLPLGNATHTAPVASTNSDGTSRFYIFDISGVDRVAFTASGTDAPATCRAACSTF